jgi:hypothetical protein
VTKRFYCEVDDGCVHKSWVVIEADGGCEHGQYYDISHFWTIDKDNAEDAVKLLNKLYKKAQEKDE